MRSRAGVIPRGLYGTWCRSSSARWLTPRKPLRVHCTTVRTTKIQPPYVSGSVLIQKKKNAFHWLNWQSTPSSEAQRCLGCSVKEEIHSTFCARCVGTPSKGHNHKPGGFLWCFPDQGRPTRLLLGCSATSLGLPWCRRGEEASGEFMGRALTSWCPPSSENSLWHSAQLILPPLAFEEERQLWRWLVDGQGGFVSFLTLPAFAAV